MRQQIYWIDLPMAGRLAIMARPRAGDWLEDEISGWRAHGIDLVISLLEQEEVSELGLQREADLCQKQVWNSFHSLFRTGACPGHCETLWPLPKRSQQTSVKGDRWRCTVEPESDDLLSSRRARSFARAPIRRLHLRRSPRRGA